MTLALAVNGRPADRRGDDPARHVATAVPAVVFDNWYVYRIGPLLRAAIAALSIRYVFAPRPDLATPVTP